MCSFWSIIKSKVSIRSWWLWFHGRYFMADMDVQFCNIFSFNAAHQYSICAYWSCYETQPFDFICNWMLEIVFISSLNRRRHFGPKSLIKHNAYEEWKMEKWEFACSTLHFEWVKLMHYCIPREIDWEQSNMENEKKKRRNKGKKNFCLST